MFTRFALATVFCLSVTAAPAADGDPQLKVVPARGIGPVESVTAYQTKDGKRTSVAELTKFDKPAALPNEGPFEVVVKPKGGIPVRVAEKLTVKAGETH